MASTNILEEQRKYAFIMSVKVYVCLCVLPVCSSLMEQLQGKKIEQSSNKDTYTAYETQGKGM